MSTIIVNVFHRFKITLFFWYIPVPPVVQPLTRTRKSIYSVSYTQELRRFFFSDFLKTYSLRSRDLCVSRVKRREIRGRMWVRRRDFISHF